MQYSILKRLERKISRHIKKLAFIRIKFEIFQKEKRSIIRVCFRIIVLLRRI